MQSQGPRSWARSLGWQPKRYKGLAGSPEGAATPLPACEQDTVGPIPQMQ